MLRIGPHISISKGFKQAAKDAISIDALSRIINHPQLKHLPFFLETPIELDGHRHEITLLRKKSSGLLNT